MYTWQTTITLRDADAAGVLFFARYLALAHDAYEAFLAANGLDTGRILREESFLLPVVHADADYRAPLWVGDRVTVKLWAETIKRRTFTIAYELRTSSDTLSCRARTTHVAVDKVARRAVVLPANLVAILESVYQAST